MTFDPKFEADLVLKLHDNLIQIIQDNEVDILKWANGGERMPPFEKYRRSQWYNTVFPVISLIPLWTIVDQASDDSRCDVTHQFETLFEDAGPDADAASRSVILRALAVDQLLRKQKKTAVLAGRDPTKVGAYSMEISKHEYFQVPRGQTMYLQLSSFTVTINFIESRR